MSEEPDEKDNELPENVYLVINTQVVPIRNKVSTIGRKLENDLVIQDSLVSRVHAEIRYEDNQFVIYDLKSTGGTFINNKKVDRGVLYSGDIVSLANIPLMFVMDGPGVEDKSAQKTGRLKSE